MQSRRRSRMLRHVSLIAGAAIVAAGLAACSTDAGADTGAVTEEDIQAALDEESTLTIWSWSGSLPDVAAAFEEKYPKITVKVENVGTGADHYTKLQNAIKAGKGAPDLATVEYNAIPQFALTDSLVDLNQFGFGELESEFTPATWGSVNVGEGLYELPLNAGPMALFYNATSFEKYGIEVPTTWDEFLEAARAFRAADPNAYIAADTGNTGLTESLIWAAGGNPFQVDGENVTIDLADEGSVKFSEFYQQLLDEDLLAPIASWSTEWYDGLASGNIATLLSGAWMAGTLKSGVPDGVGQWRVAPLPTYEAGEQSSSVNGGGSFAMLEQSENKLVAAAFQRFVSLEEGADITLASGSFPARSSVLESEEFLATGDEFFGGQEINQVFVESLDAVREGWQFLPYEVYAGAIFNDTVGKAFVGETSLQDGLLAWQEALVEYGDEQGFTVNR
ncbi:MAG TPA: sugar ABC transporter substrate-binding protein [Rhodoglobus sp.]|nr:sugar ABC transporter substrate-binding protein [Rhodoglobus sp.]